MTCKQLLKRVIKASLRVGYEHLLVCALAVVGVVQLVGYGHGQFHYSHVPAGRLRAALAPALAPAAAASAKGKPPCDVDAILKDDRSINAWDVPTSFGSFDPAGVANGSFTPAHCAPQFSVAILVAYRNRQSQLDVFLPYMHDFLRKQNIHYKIFVIEQMDSGPWNKGLLLNLGARAALAERFPCLVLHDVDLLPLDAGNLYACARGPRHMSASIDKFRFVLPYPQLVGGVLALQAEQFVAADGFSNRFLGWGGEDDDFERRLRDHGLDVLRFPRTRSRYTMLQHAQEPRNAARRRLLAARGAGAGDGLRAAPARHRALDVRPHRLYTLVAVTT